jgi:hypothetical protein
MEDTEAPDVRLGAPGVPFGRVVAFIGTRVPRVATFAGTQAKA